MLQRFVALAEGDAERLASWRASLRFEQGLSSNQVFHFEGVTRPILPADSLSKVHSYADADFIVF